MGLRGGTGGGCSKPFLREAPVGRLIVSITDVAEMKTGSEMSDFCIDFLRCETTLLDGIVPLEPKDEATGVVEAEIGGVELAENGVGDGDGRKELTPGLTGPRGGRDDSGKLGDNPGDKPGVGLLAAGDSRGDEPSIGLLPTCRG
jgi:hypothetical protein